MPPFPADAAMGPGELLELDRELRGPADDRGRKAIALLERTLAFSRGPEGIAPEAFASPVAQLHLGAAGEEGLRRLETRLEQLRAGQLPRFEVHQGLLPYLELPANANGWRALREHLSATYGKRYTPDLTLVMPAARLQMRAQGHRFLEEIWVFAHPAGHWHYVTFGLTALVDEMPAAPDGADGWGFELSMRVAPGKGEQGIPSWPVAVLHNLAAYVQNSRSRFDVHHHMSYGRALSGEPSGALRAVGFVLDPELKQTVTPYGAAKFLQLVALTPDEEAFMAEWSAAGFFGALAEVDPLFVVHRDRTSSLSQPGFGAELRARAAAEGSSQEVTFVKRLRVDQEGDELTVTLGSASHGVGLARHLAGLFRGRLMHQRPFDVAMPEHPTRVRFEPSDQAGHRRSNGLVGVPLDAAGARAWVQALDAIEGEGEVSLGQVTLVFEDEDTPDL